MTTTVLSTSVPITITVNGKVNHIQISPDLTVAELLQEELGLSGTKVCCGMGVCKACTVAFQRPGARRLDRIQACITPASVVEGGSITTVEGLASSPTQEALHPLQSAFLRHFSFQCGYSAPGFLMGAYILIDSLKAQPISKHQVDQVIEEHLGDHICRCSGYKRYHQAIKEVILATPGATRT